MVTINFGKYKNQDVEDVFKKDPNYCVWLMRQPTLSTEDDPVRELLKKKLFDSDAYYMTWGKYKGQALKVIAATDYKYIEWLKENTFVNTKCQALKKALTTI